MKYDFTSILDRNGKDSIAVNPPMEAGWVNFAPVKEAVSYTHLTLPTNS